MTRIVDMLHDISRDMLSWNGHNQLRVYGKYMEQISIASRVGT